MKIGFFTVFKREPHHFLHASSLVREAHRIMPGIAVVQLTDDRTPVVPDVDDVQRGFSDRPLLEQRIRHYANLSGEWLLLDTDVSIRAHVGGVFDDPLFDVCLCDRNWPHSQQGEQMMHTMPFNTGVVFKRSQQFWVDVLDTWYSYPDAVKANWMSEQGAVYDVVRRGRYRVKILPGMAYNYPPGAADAVPPIAALVHYKGPRKEWLTPHAYRVLSHA